MDFKIVKAVTSDAEEIQRVTSNASIGMYQLCGWSDKDINTRVTEEKIKEGTGRLADSIANFTDNEVILIAKNNEKIIGYSYAERQKDRNVLEAMYVLPEYQGSGVAHELWEETLNNLFQDRPTYLQVLAHNSKAIRFYKKLGFVETDKRFVDDNFKNSNGIPLEEIEMMRSPKTKWQEYAERTMTGRPRPLLVEALRYIKERKLALDLGSGAFNDVRYLISEGFEHVDAVDKEALAAEVLKGLSTEKISYIVSAFEEFRFPKNRYDLVNAQFSLPFIDKHQFARVYTLVVNSLKKGSVFCGQFFGNRDEWNKPHSNMNFKNKSEARELLKGFEIIKFEEEENDGKTAMGESKHWHIFHFICRKS